MACKLFLHTCFFNFQRFPPQEPRQEHTTKVGPGQIAPPLPKPAPGVTMASKHLSMTRSSLKNDPLWLEFGDHDFVGLIPSRGLNVFANTYEGFVPIVNRQYDLISSADRSFTKFISRTMWLYYCTEHLYGRLIAIKRHSGLISREGIFADSFRSEYYPVPNSVERYLQSIGNTTDAAGNKFQLRTPAWPNQNGNFGPVDAATHWQYESMVAPLILTERMKQDVTITLVPQHDPVWNLPTGLQPVEEECGLPTANLLGWATAARLTTEQLQALQGAGVTPADFPVDDEQFQMNRGLFEFIADHVRSLSNVLKLGASFHEGADGSIVQTIGQVRDDQEVKPFTRRIQYSEYEVSAYSSTHHDERLVTGAMVCTFRIKKDRIGGPSEGLHTWACLDFGKYTNVPAAWVNTRNELYEWGQVHQWNASNFRSAFTIKDTMRTSWLRKSLLHPTRY
jgi:hypothetical protein